MKVLYVGNYRDGTGWAKGAESGILALDAAGVQVVPRCVRFGRGQGVAHPRIQELEAASARGCDVVIQHSLPYVYERAGSFRKFVGSYYTETSNFRSSNWARSINLMDEAWVACTQNRYASLASGVTVPVRVLPVACDTDKFLRSYEPLPLRKQLGDAFVLYTIAEAVPRKNLRALVTAFHLEFRPSEDVELLLKTNVPGKTPEESRAILRGELQKIRQGLNLYADDARYKRELLLVERLNETDMCRLHTTGDCYVGPSHGEGWNLGAFDAMGFGKTPILSAWGAHTDFLPPAAGWLVDGRMEPVIGMEKVHGDLYGASQEWFSVDIARLRRAMREAFESRHASDEMAECGMEAAQEHSFAEVGKLMREALEDGLA